MLKKINFFKTIFHIINLILVVLYLYPGSILGWLLYNDFSLQPQIIRNYAISLNHFFAFLLLSSIGIFSYHNEKYFFLLLKSLFLASIFLEILHTIIPERSFQFGDLFGNFLGVFAVVIFYRFWVKS